MYYFTLKSGIVFRTPEDWKRVSCDVAGDRKVLSCDDTRLCGDVLIPGNGDWQPVKGFSCYWSNVVATWEALAESK